MSGEAASGRGCCGHFSFVTFSSSFKDNYFVFVFLFMFVVSSALPIWLMDTNLVLGWCIVWLTRREKRKKFRFVQNKHKNKRKRLRRTKEIVSSRVLRNDSGEKMQKNWKNGEACGRSCPYMYVYKKRESKRKKGACVCARMQQRVLLSPASRSCVGGSFCPIS